MKRIKIYLFKFFVQHIFLTNLMLKFFKKKKKTNLIRYKKYFKKQRTQLVRYGSFQIETQLSNSQNLTKINRSKQFPHFSY